MTTPPPASVKLWMPWFIQERRSEASTLTHTEHSVLCYLHMLLWERDGTVPDDDRWIAKNVRLSVAQWKGMRNTILQGCVIAGGQISHPALQAEIVKARLNVEQKRKAGQASAAARKAQREGNGCSTAVATAVQPRAGSGVGSGLSQCSTTGVEVGDRPFRVVGGGGQ